MYKCVCVYVCVYVRKFRGTFPKGDTTQYMYTYVYEYTRTYVIKLVFMNNTLTKERSAPDCSSRFLVIWVGACTCVCIYVCMNVCIYV